jgi:hypothetical protein
LTDQGHWNLLIGFVTNKQNPNMKKMQDTISHFMDTLATNALIKGGVPVVAGAAISFMEQVEQWMRLTSLGIGIAIGLLVFISRLRAELKK